MPILTLKARPFADLADLSSTAAADAGAELDEWGVTAVSHHPFRVGDFPHAMAYGLELFSRWDEVLSRCGRSHNGMRGPTATGQERHEGQQETEIKEYLSFQMDGGLPDFLSVNEAHVLRVCQVLHESNVAAACAAAQFYGRDIEQLRSVLTARGIFSAGRLNRYRKAQGFSQLHLDTSAVAALVFRKPFQVKRKSVIYDVEVEGNGPVIVHNFGKSLSLYLLGSRRAAVEHGVPVADWDKISLVWFTNFVHEAVWPQDVVAEVNNPVSQGASIEEWCLREIGLWGVLEDLNAGEQV